MDIFKVKIVTDSSADLTGLARVPFAAAPLKIITDSKQYTDDASLDVTGMVQELAAYRGRSTTSCPNPAEWLEAFGEAKFVFCFPLTAALSGSYNAALVAKRTYEQEHPDRRVFVLNTLTTGPQLALLVEKAEELVLSGLDFDGVCRGLTDYQKRTGLLFMLASMRNLANNGRVSQLTAKMAGLLGIRVIAKASDKGDVEALEKCRGEKKALSVLLEHLEQLGFSGGRLRIAHCLNPEGAAALKELILRRFPSSHILTAPSRGLCSFYAEQGGLLLGFER